MKSMLVSYKNLNLQLHPRRQRAGILHEENSKEERKECWCCLDPVFFFHSVVVILVFITQFA